MLVEHAAEDIKKEAGQWEMKSICDLLVDLSVKDSIFGSL